ncbi:heme peroxidase family protein [Haloechinothrix sp. LS1_15]|uniref:peroxidase family protein n=1 Tax=Haloechinothrix sp. LS1_15 TaxID=2652248 RepID=UPI00294AB720|nr:heme peroxidase family protein [Haloechinothrix sp. LS1_15]
MVGSSALLYGNARAGTAITPHRKARTTDSRFFSRLFDLPSFAEPTDEVTNALRQLGAHGGLMDAADPLHLPPEDLITEPEHSENNPDNPSHTAGTTFFGQFMDHDMTFDETSELGKPTDPETSPNTRTPSFDLDSMYGRGPSGDPQYYNPLDPITFRIESGGRFEDLPRDDRMVAIIPDGRNDENIMISGLHVAMCLFHNRVVEWIRLRRPGAGDEEVFAEARKQVTWHYQWLILHEFLPLFVGQPMVDDVLSNGRQFFRPDRPVIPVEFQAAAYRFGHSMVRPSYLANDDHDPDNPFFGFIFEPTNSPGQDPEDLRGSARAPRRFIGWQTFFDFDDGGVRPNKRIDTKISTPLFRLPLLTIPPQEPPISLMERNLLRHLTWEVPSGQAIAETMDAPELPPSQLQDLTQFRVGFERHTPLFFYILREAEFFADGLHLGPVGGRIVAEVIIGLLETDPDSYLSQDPSWRPELPSRNPGEYTMTDLLRFAGVHPRR